MCGSEGVRRNPRFDEDEDGEEDGGKGQRDDGSEFRPAEVGAEVEAGEE